MRSNNKQVHGSGKNLKIAILLNLAFFVIEILCGNWFNSKIIIADAIHDLGDVLLLGSSFFIDKISRKKPTDKYSYGFRRLSVFAAIINAVVIIFGSWQLLNWIYFELTVRHNHPFVNIPGLLTVSILGIIINFFAAWRVYGSKSLLDKTIFTHLLEDLLGWVVSLLTAVLIGFTGLHQLDQAVSILILAIVSWNAISNAYQISKVLLQAAPSEKDLLDIKNEILKISPSISKIEDTHFWSMDGEHHVFTARILVKDASNNNDIRKKISKILIKFGVVDSTIEFLSE